MADNIGVSSTSDASSNKDDVVVVEGSNERPVSDKESAECDRYVWIAVLGKEIGKENGVIKVKQLAVLNYVRLDKMLPAADKVREYRMFFIKQDGSRVQLGIHGGGLRPSSSPTGDILKFTGPDANLTISNDASASNDRRYLRVRRLRPKGRSLTTTRNINGNSYFKVSIFPSETIETFKIQVANKPNLYFRYMTDQNIVTTDTFRQEEEASYIFELASLEDCRVHFVGGTECI